MIISLITNCQKFFMALYKILVLALFNGCCYHFIHQFMTNYSQSFKKDLTVGLILKHSEQTRRTRKGIFCEERQKIMNYNVCFETVLLMFSVFDRINQ